MDEVETHTVIAVKQKKQKSMLWLWLSLGALVLVIAGLVAGYMIVKSAADVAAANYEVQLKTYVDTVYDESTSAADDPAIIVTGIRGVKAPFVQDAFLGEAVSPNYKKALQNSRDSQAQVKTLADTVAGYGQVYQLYSKYKTDQESVVTLTESGQTKSSEAQIEVVFDKIRAVLVDMKGLVDQSSLPLELATSRASLADAQGSVVSTWDTFITARKSGTTADYIKATKAYDDANTAASDALGTIGAYYNSIANRTRLATNAFKDFKDSIN